jgi:hypothetical protein
MRLLPFALLGLLCACPSPDLMKVDAGKDSGPQEDHDRR